MYIWKTSQTLREEKQARSGFNVTASLSQVVKPSHCTPSFNVMHLHKTHTHTK